jgi:hypothetical protein
MGVHGSPEWVAAQFTAMSHSVDYSWPNIGYWTTLVQGYVTQSYGSSLLQVAAAAQAATASGNGNSADAHLWQEVELGQEDIGAQVTSASVMPQAGITSTSEVVRVTWYPDAITKQIRAAGGSPRVSGSPQQAEDHMVKIGGKWEVASVTSAISGA